MKKSCYNAAMKDFQNAAMNLKLESAKDFNISLTPLLNKELAQTPEGDWKRKHILEDLKKALNDISAMHAIGERKGFA